MKPSLLTLSAALMVLTIIPHPAMAEVTAVQEFRAAVSRLKSIDASLSGVGLVILGPSQNKTSCGVVDNSTLVANYCPKSRTIYATASTVNQVKQAYGAAGVRFLAAHELGHARQHAITGFASEQVWSDMLDELQADCIAGAYLNMAYGYTSDSSIASELQSFAKDLGDHAFYQRTSHGPPSWRANALTRGMRTGDPKRCLSSNRFNYEALRQTGAELLRQLRSR